MSKFLSTRAGVLSPPGLIRSQGRNAGVFPSLKNMHVTLEGLTVTAEGSDNVHI